MSKTISQHPLVANIPPSVWARYSDGRRMFEIKRAQMRLAEQLKPQAEVKS